MKRKKKVVSTNFGWRIEDLIRLSLLDSLDTFAKDSIADHSFSFEMWPTQQKLRDWLVLCLTD